MNEGIMYTWEVHGQYGLIWNCAHKETAEYLRDWEEAQAENTMRRLEKDHPQVNWRTARLKMERFSVLEGEVLL